MSKLNILTKGLFKENPVLVLVLGTSPTLAVTTPAKNTRRSSDLAWVWQPLSCC